MNTEERTTEQELSDAMEMLGAGYDSVVKDEAPHDHYSQIPNMVDDYGLSPQAYRLYGHLRRVAGESGKCWQNTRTLSQSCSMSAGSVSNAKKELLETEFIPFIRIKKVAMKTGFSYDEITLTDLWRINHDVYQKDTVHNVNGSEYERLVHNVKQRITLLKNNQNTIDINETDQKIFSALSELTGGALNTEVPRFVDSWKEKHSVEWVLKAVGIARDKGARSVKYVDSILIGWEANGYPKTREQQVEERRTDKPSDVGRRVAQNVFGN